ncbi:phosphocholine-specific phospholipase C [Sphingobacterium suaedae]|uniref:phospholipase C n=1 Tax=Sphingobacterium suaedae TaxID=1686402 RepID=A0ABW5KIQ9_9SPHI
MESRREFIKKAGMLAGSLGLLNSLPPTIQAALKIDPAVGSSYLDAEHIVLLMQENRSFDHSFGSLKGVRGFNDRRAVMLPDQKPVWLQSYKNGDTYLPFRLDIKNSHAAWTRDLPHSWENQIGAWNKGNFNNWLEWKRSGNKKYRDLPLTMGYYTRADIPFYYAFADAFTICDQHFCSSITGTTTNRHFFWTGTCVPEKGAKPLVRNSDIYFNRMARWQTFPERLQDANISWKVYQNEVSIQNELMGEAESLLGNFTDNNLEWFEQYHIRYKKSHINFYKKRIEELPVEISEIENALARRPDQKLQQKLQQKQQQLESFRKEYEQFNELKFEQLDNRSKSLHQRAFQTNENDPNYHRIEEVTVDGTSITVPKGDILHQFRQDVKKGQLPTVSWLCAPQHFSDHPSAPMYGAWYVSEILQILTENPDIWKKTIFILNYDENDGYFDHIPPFVAPKPGDPSTGAASPDLDYSSEYVSKEQELAYGIEPEYATEGPVGLGYRVPLIIASPWTKGGWVNSEVCDITSTIQFMEHFLFKKFGVNVFEENISSWRRAITGDLTSVFRTFEPKENTLPSFLDRNTQIMQINQAKDKPAPNNFRKLTETEIEQVRQGQSIPISPKQEPGIKFSTAIPYELHVYENLQQQTIQLRFESSTNFFGKNARGGAFNVFAYGFKPDRANWSFACSAGKSVLHQWSISDFENDIYHLAVYGPNGYYRAYYGSSREVSPEVELRYDIPRETLIFQLKNPSNKTLVLHLTDAYQDGFNKHITLHAHALKTVGIPLKKQNRWYDIQLTLARGSFRRNFAGRLENGKHSVTDPLMALTR